MYEWYLVVVWQSLQYSQPLEKYLEIMYILKNTIQKCKFIDYIMFEMLHVFLMFLYRIPHGVFWLMRVPKHKKKKS